MIKDFPNHPFKVKDDEKMNDLVESVKENGVLYPLLVRLKEDGNYELISGHRRKRVAQKLNIDSVKWKKEELLATQENVNSEEYIEKIAMEKLEMYYPNKTVFIDITK